LLSAASIKSGPRRSQAGSRRCRRYFEVGDGIGIAVVAQAGHPGDSTGWVTQRYAAVATIAAGLIERQTNYADIDEARAAAERLAGERG
jgi:ketosteroid isomerase-like protein